MVRYVVIGCILIWSVHQLPYLFVQDVVNMLDHLMHVLFLEMNELLLQLLDHVMDKVNTWILIYQELLLLLHYHLIVIDQ